MDEVMLAKASIWQFCSLGSCFISIYLKLVISHFTFSKYAAMTRLPAIKFPLTCLIINAVLKIEIFSTLNFLANSSTAISALYSAFLFEAFAPNRRECSFHSFCPLLRRMLVLDPFSFDQPSTYKLHASVEFVFHALVAQIL